VQVTNVLEQAWNALNESRDYETVVAFVRLAFQPALLCTPALSCDRDAPLRKYCRGVRHIGKLFRGPAGELARQLVRVWELHPQVHSARTHTPSHTHAHTLTEDDQAVENFIPECVRLCVFGYTRKGENEMSGTSLFRSPFAPACG
jgi:hypothetical protein